MLWLGLHYPALGLEVFASQAHPVPSCQPGPSVEAAKVPSVLIEQGQVVLCDQQAAQLGIRPGVTAATANTIAGDLQHLQRAPQRELSRLKVLAETLYQLTPQVAIEPPATLLLEISASVRLFGSAQVLAQQSLRLSKELGHVANARLAATPGAALALATTGIEQLEQVPLSALNLSEQSVERFVNMGLKRVQDVIALPAKELAQRFGTQTLTQLRQLTGEHSDPRSFIQLSPTFNRTVELLDPIRNKQGLLFPMQRLASELKHWLISAQLAVGQLRWRFAAAASVHSAAPAVTVLADFAQPHQNSHKMLQISQLRLDQAELPPDVLSVSVEATRLAPCQPAATDLFDRRQAAGAEGAVYSTPNELLDQLKARLGAAACRQLEAVDQHHPTWQSREPVNNSFATSDKKSTAQAHSPSQRPVWLCRPPKPVSFKVLQLLHGPERIRTAWWHKGICRDYYIARYRHNSHCWVFTDDSGHWFIHGYFA